MSRRACCHKGVALKLGRKTSDDDEARATSKNLKRLPLLEMQNTVKGSLVLALVGLSGLPQKAMSTKPFLSLGRRSWTRASSPTKWCRRGRGRVPGQGETTTIPPKRPRTPIPIIYSFIVVAIFKYICNQIYLVILRILQQSLFV